MKSVSGRDPARVVERRGGRLLRIHGSHHIYDVYGGRLQRFEPQSDLRSFWRSTPLWRATARRIAFSVPTRKFLCAGTASTTLKSPIFMLSTSKASSARLKVENLLRSASYSDAIPCSGAVLSAENAGGDTGDTEVSVTILCKPLNRFQRSDIRGGGRKRR